MTFGDYIFMPFPPPGDLLDPGIELESSASPALQAHSLPAEPLGPETGMREKK